MCDYVSVPHTGGSKSPARRESTANVKTANDEKHSRETEKLNKQINRYREIIEQQEILIQVMGSLCFVFVNQSITLLSL